ncbi:MAG: HAD family phosphatase [Solobacterium sp.]|nr:HAD family phosphatase [Solobacterium sp.]
MLKGAIFDMDGLMFDTEQIWQKNWKLIADEMGVSLAEEFKYNICGTSGALMNSVIEKYYGVEDGSGIAADCKKRVHDDLMESTPEKPGVHEILEFFRDAGVRIAVASSSSVEQIRRNLQNTNTEDFIEVIVSGTELKRGKPEPDIFLTAAEKLGIDPCECYVFEDAFNGVKAGHAAGCCTIMIPDQMQPTEEIRALADAVCASLFEARDLLASGAL